MDTVSINNITGELRTIGDNVFDYERQTEVYFQAFAHDNLQTRNETNHTTFTQIRINIEDVNDTPPQLILVNLRKAEIEVDRSTVRPIRIERFLAKKFLIGQIVDFQSTSISALNHLNDFF